jgi:hypothetical protein
MIIYAAPERSNSYRRSKATNLTAYSSGTEQSGVLHETERSYCFYSRSSRMELRGRVDVKIEDNSNSKSESNFLNMRIALIYV